MSVIKDIEALRYLREPSYTERVARIVTTLRDFNDELIANRQRIEQLQAEIEEWESGALVRGWREIREEKDDG